MSRCRHELVAEGVDRLFPDERRARGPDPATASRCRARGPPPSPAWRPRSLDGSVSLDRSADRARTRDALLGRPGIGPWTADYVLMRALGDPDVFLPTDVAVRRVLDELRHRSPTRSRVPRPGGPGARTRSCTSGRRSLRTCPQPHQVRHRTQPEPEGTTEMWTIMDSPVGELRLVAVRTAP